MDHSQDPTDPRDDSSLKGTVLEGQGLDEDHVTDNTKLMFLNSRLSIGTWQWTIASSNFMQAFWKSRILVPIVQFLLADQQQKHQER